MSSYTVTIDSKEYPKPIGDKWCVWCYTIGRKDWPPGYENFPRGKWGLDFPAKTRIFNPDTTKDPDVTNNPESQGRSTDYHVYRGKNDKGEERQVVYREIDFDSDTFRLCVVTQAPCKGAADAKVSLEWLFVPTDGRPARWVEWLYEGGPTAWGPETASISRDAVPGVAVSGPESPLALVSLVEPKRAEPAVADQPLALPDGVSPTPRDLA